MDERVKTLALGIHSEVGKSLYNLLKSPNVRLQFKSLKGENTDEKIKGYWKANWTWQFDTATRAGRELRLVEITAPNFRKYILSESYFRKLIVVVQPQQ